MRPTHRKPVEPFYARYEASKYGSRYIDTEHLLLGLLKDRNAVARWFPGVSNVESKIRAEIEKRITRGERISESVEMPLSSEGKKVLTLATEARKKLRHQSVEPEHILIAMFQVESSLAAQILSAQGLNVRLIQEQLSKASSQKPPTEPDYVEPSLTLNQFLTGLRALRPEDLIDNFAANAVFVDASGKRWTIQEISKHFEALFAWYAKKNATYEVETVVETDELFVALVLWKNLLLASEERSWMHRMSVVLVMEEEDWKIQLVQVTPVLPTFQAPPIT